MLVESLLRPCHHLITVEPPVHITTHPNTASCPSPVMKRAGVDYVGRSSYSQNPRVDPRSAKYKAAPREHPNNPVSYVRDRPPSTPTRPHDNSYSTNYDAVPREHTQINAPSGAQDPCLSPNPNPPTLRRSGAATYSTNHKPAPRAYTPDSPSLSTRGLPPTSKHSGAATYANNYAAAPRVHTRNSPTTGVEDPLPSAHDFATKPKRSGVSTHSASHKPSLREHTPVNPPLYPQDLPPPTQDQTPAPRRSGTINDHPGYVSPAPYSTDLPRTQHGYVAGLLCVHDLSPMPVRTPAHLRSQPGDYCSKSGGKRYVPLAQDSKFGHSKPSSLSNYDSLGCKFEPNNHDIQPTQEHSQRDPRARCKDDKSSPIHYDCELQIQEHGRGNARPMDDHSSARGSSIEDLLSTAREYVRREAQERYNSTSQKRRADCRHPRWRQGTSVPGLARKIDDISKMLKAIMRDPVAKDIFDQRQGEILGQ